jgi:hypothetical protein
MPGGSRQVNSKKESAMRCCGWLAAAMVVIGLCGCTFKNTSKNEETAVGGEQRESPPATGVTEDPGSPQPDR